MTDFYSVLKSSIIQRNLSSPAARHDVYDQAREAMIRRLWSLDPPLSEDEIDARIGLFDAAVDKIEQDLGRSFAPPETADRRGPRPSGTPREPTPERVPQASTSNGRRDVGHAPTDHRQSRRGDKMPRPTTALSKPRDRAAPKDQRQRIRDEVSQRLRDAGYDEQVAATHPHERPDDGWPVAEGDVSAPRPQALGRDPGYRRAVRQPTIREYDTYAEPDYDETIVDDEYVSEAPRNLPATRQASRPNPSFDDNEYRGNGYFETSYQHEGYRQPRYEEAAYYEYDDQEPDPPYHAERLRRGTYPHAARRDVNARSADDVYPDELEPPPARYPSADRRSGKRIQVDDGNRSQRWRGRSIPILAITIGVLAVVLIAFNLYVFLPILMGSDPSQSATVTPPSKFEDRLPTLETPDTGSARIGNNSATAVEIPQRNLDVAESLVIFDGTDPTVFEGTSNNPIQYDSDSEGSFARISSTASAAGARAIIGPGLTDRLAGRTIRVTIVARSSKESGAAQMRFAYQSGLALSHWQNAALSANYGTYGLIWRLPATETSVHDYLLIEPGIPGDGTSTDIRMIKIDVLAQ